MHKAQDTTSPAGGKNVACEKALPLTYLDSEARIARVETLKAQVDAGNYAINSSMLAQKLQNVVCRVLEPVDATVTEPKADG